jgi:hypothetical protein
MRLKIENVKTFFLNEIFGIDRRFQQAILQ